MVTCSLSSPLPLVTLTLCKLRESESMREFEFSKDEAVIAKDDLLRRLLARVAPEVRLDFIGWMGLNKFFAVPEIAKESDEVEAPGSAMKEYLMGASLALDLVPNREYNFLLSDREAMAADINQASDDLHQVADLIIGVIQRELDERPDGSTGRSVAERTD